VQLKSAPRARGFSLIELMVALTIMAILITLAMPLYRDWLANTQIRNATESISSGIRLTQAEAIKRNGQVEFALTPSTGWEVWEVRDNVATTLLQAHQFTSGSKSVTVVPTPAAATGVRFTGLGRMMEFTADGAAHLTQVDVTSAIATDPRPLRVIVGLEGAGPALVRMCDPHFASTDPTGCP
jgi:type IV fimbrial biogenesis protein FimT